MSHDAETATESSGNVKSEGKKGAWYFLLISGGMIIAATVKGALFVRYRRSIISYLMS